MTLHSRESFRRSQDDLRTTLGMSGLFMPRPRSKHLPRCYKQLIAAIEREQRVVKAARRLKHCEVK